MLKNEFINLFLNFNHMKKNLLFAAMFLGLVGNAMADDVTTATYGNKEGNTVRTLTIALNHADADYCAFQLDLTIPEGATVGTMTAKTPLVNGKSVTISGASESTNFVLAGNTQADGKYRIVGYNLGNEVIGTGEVLLTIPLTTTEGVAFNAAEVTASDVLFVKKTSTTLEEVSLSTSADQRLWGDVVKDGKVDATDYQAVANIVTKIGNGSIAVDKFAADVDESDSVDATDYQAIGNIVTGTK